MIIIKSLLIRITIIYHHDYKSKEFHEKVSWFNEDFDHNSNELSIFQEISDSDRNRIIKSYKYESYRSQS